MATNPGKLGEFVATSPGWTVDPAFVDAPLDDGGARHTKSVFEFTGTFTSPFGTILRIQHDDGVSLAIDGTTVINAPNVTDPVAITESFLERDAGLHSFTLFYGECCDLPATLVFTQTDVPEPSSLALIGSALFGLGALRRRRTNT